jgi:SAM-dependent methyltransferase
MTTISSSAPQLELSSVAFFGRTLAEYTRFFALDLPVLRGRAVLDVAAGPASFAVEAAVRGIDAVALDPLYGCRPEALAAHVAIDYRRMHERTRARPHLVELGPVFASLDEAEASRCVAAERFLRDYESGFLHGRYVGGALPRLPFLDRQFDLVLCAHLLFVYARQLDYDFHVAACAELVRVSTGEVRVHPLCGHDGRRYPELTRLRCDLADLGIVTEIVPVDYAFFAGTSSMLVLRRHGPLVNIRKTRKQEGEVNRERTRSGANPEM